MGFIKKIFDEAFASQTPPFVINEKFLRSVEQYSLSFLHKNEDHIKFFGGNLFGVNPIRFVTSDKNIWLDDIVQLDEYEIRERIIAPETGVSEDWVRATDIMNLSCLYLCHRIYNSTLPEKDKHAGMVNVLMILHYKFLSSLMAHYFNKAPANEATALAVYAALSKKYAIKQHGNWQAMLTDRCKDIISNTSIHKLTISKFDDDDAIVYMVTDTQGRMRNVVKKQYQVFVEVRAQNAKITSVGGHVQLESGLAVRDVSRLYTPYVRYLAEISSNKPVFIKEDLISVVGSAIQTMPEQLLLDSLNYICEHTKDKLVDDLLKEIMLHAFEFLASDPSSRHALKDISLLLSKLRGLYMASRSSNPSIIKMRALGEKVVSKAIKSKSPSTVASVRTGVFLYVITRVFAKSYYT